MAWAGAAALRRRLQQLEGRAGLSSQAGARASGTAAPVSLGAVEVDACFRHGGLEHGVHHAAGEGTLPLGFTCALLARALGARRQARALIVQEADAVREHGALYAPGLQALGVDPGRVVQASPAQAEDALRIADDAARCGAFKAVVVELRRGEARLDLTLTRRFNLAAEASGALVLLATPTLDSTSAALTRWEVRPDPQRTLTAEARRLLGRPTFDLTLTRNRLGPAPVRLTLEWDCHERTFGTPAPIPAAVAAAPGQRDSGGAHAGPRPRTAAGGGRQVG